MKRNRAVTNEIKAMLLSSSSLLGFRSNKERGFLDGAIECNHGIFDDLRPLPTLLFDDIWHGYCLCVCVCAKGGDVLHLRGEVLVQI